MPATGAQMVFTDWCSERTVKVNTWPSCCALSLFRMLLLQFQLLLQVEVSNTSTWADAAFVTGSGKRIKAVLLHQVKPQRPAIGRYLLQPESHSQHAACTQGLQATCC